MHHALPHTLLPEPIPPHLDYAALGPGFAQLLAALPGLSDAALSALPDDWANLPGLLVTLIADEGLSTEAAAHEASVPVSLVRDYRTLMGI